MRRRLVAVLALAPIALAAGCGAEDRPLDGACTASARAIERALERAPAPVTLGTGTRLSDCVARARDDADLQNAGAVLSRAADDLSARARRGDARAAVGLGYLVGAARRGSAHTAGIHAELRRRVESAAAFLDEAGAGVVRALRRGVRAGEATG